MRAFIWTNVFTLVPMGCYALQAVIDATENRWGLAIMFAGYSAANIGVILVRYT